MLEPLLETLRAEGSLDSRGIFTLSREQLVEKLGRRPFAAIPWLVGAALESGATFLRFTRKPGELVLSHDGTPPLDLSGSHLDAVPVGLLAAAREGVTLTAAGQRLTARGESWKVRSARGKDVTVRLSSRADPGPWLERLRLAPVPVEVDGAAWSRPPLPGEFLVERRGPDAHLGLGSPVFTAVGPLEPSLVLVVGCVSIPCELARPHARAVVYTSAVRRTLELDQVVQDDAYRALLADLHARFAELAAQLAERAAAPGCPPGWAVRARQVLSGSA